MVAQLDPRDWYIKKQKLLYKADNYIGRKNLVICYELITLQEIQIYEHSNCIVLKCIFLLFTRSELDILRLDKYMIFKCKSSSSSHCDCVQSITVEKVDAFHELKIFKNNCSTMLRKHFQPIKQCHMTI